MNIGNGITKEYSSAYKDQLAKTQGDTQNCHQHYSSVEQSKPENILILIVESWSAYHSKLWSGINDWTPALDSIARRSTRYSQFHAGGHTTNQGLYSILSGRYFLLPLTPPDEAKAFDGAWNLTNTLPQELTNFGYSSAFVTSGDLNFTRKGEWLRNIGFDSVEGSEYPGYEGVARSHFNAVPDDVLYLRALKLLGEQVNKGSPHLTVVESVSSHHPFKHPYTQERSEEAVIRFVDRAAADFLSAVIESGFLDNGIIVTLSDHRAMTFISSAEQKLFGRGAASLVPAFIITDDSSVPVEIDKLLHQADLKHTLLSRIDPDYCKTEYRANMSTRLPEKDLCVFHGRGDMRDRIDVFCDRGEGTLVVDGDDSYFVDLYNINSDQQKSLLDEIAMQRIKSQKHK